MKRKLLAVALAGGTFLGVRAYAHHSFASTYLESERITIEGDVLQFLYRNPHSFLHVEAKDASGKMIRCAIEWGGAAQLGGQGIQSDTLKAGDHVIVLGAPGRSFSEDHRIRMVSVQRPADKKTWGQPFN
ncbi:MAG: DUF6152 family protein [Acidobacteriota bacterium]